MSHIFTGLLLSSNVFIIRCFSKPSNRHPKIKFDSRGPVYKRAAAGIFSDVSAVYGHLLDRRDYRPTQQALITYLLYFTSHKSMHIYLLFVKYLPIIYTRVGSLSSEPLRKGCIFVTSIDVFSVVCDSCYVT